MNKILLISGKRKCGKDFIAEKLRSRLAESAVIVRISEPIKTEWARQLKLDLRELLSDGPYKEQYRREMIVWSDEQRASDYGYFCRAAMSSELVQRADFIIVSDVRRKNDIRWFRETYGENVVHTLRLTSLPETREARGWTFTTGVDDVASECDLDDYSTFDYVLANDSVDQSEQLITTLIEVFKLNGTR